MSRNTPLGPVRISSSSYLYISHMLDILFPIFLSHMAILLKEPLSYVLGVWFYLWFSFYNCILGIVSPVGSSYVSEYSHFGISCLLLLGEGLNFVILRGLSTVMLTFRCFLTFLITSIFRRVSHLPYAALVLLVAST